MNPNIARNATAFLQTVWFGIGQILCLGVVGCIGDHCNVMRRPWLAADTAFKEFDSLFLIDFTPSNLRLESKQAVSEYLQDGIFSRMT